MNVNSYCLWILEVRAQGILLVFPNILKASRVVWSYGITVVIIKTL